MTTKTDNGLSLGLSLNACRAPRQGPSSGHPFSCKAVKSLLTEGVGALG